MTGYLLFPPKQPNLVQRLCDQVFIVGFLVVLLTASCFLLGATFFVGGLLQFFEVSSVFSRVFSDAPIWTYFASAVGLQLATIHLGKCIPD